MRAPYRVHGPGMITPTRLPPGMMKVGLMQKMRPASCVEVNCPRLQEGWTAADGGPFRGHVWCASCHQVPAQGGCECVRVAGLVLIPGIHHEPGEPCTVLHKTRDDHYEPIYNVQMKGDTQARPCTASEFQDRLHIGFDSIIRVRTRGL